MRAAETQPETDLYSIEVEGIEGQRYSLSRYQGSVLLIVNTASKCGFTPQYAGLNALHQQYVSRGLVVLGFPCDQFGGQEPGTESDIQTFCETNYQVRFSLHKKLEVKGDNAHPLFKFLTAKAPGVLGTKAIKWNFTKFLVDHQAQHIERFSSATDPNSLIPKIEALLGKAV